jgi:Tripartite tricarboxylate transporter TctB family
MIVGVGALFFCGLSLANDLFKGHTHEAREAERVAAGEAADKIHMDIGSNITHLPARTIFFRGMVFFGYLVGFLISMAIIGLIPTVPLFVVTFMRVEGREPWKIVIPMMLCITGLVYGLFDQLLSIPWPGSLLGEWFPLLKEYIPSM